MASQGQLMWRKFVRHRLAIVGGCILVAMYLGALVCEFIAPYDVDRQVDLAYRTALARAPAPEEAALARQLVADGSLEDLTHVVFNLSEFVYRR